MAPTSGLPTEPTVSAQAILPRSSNSFTLPSNITDTLVECAQACLTNDVFQQYHGRCGDPLSAECLCSKYSSQGYTLGELAFLCVATNCKNPSRDDRITAYYSLCAGQPSAAIPTHSSLTIVKTATSSPHSSSTTTTTTTTTASSSMHTTSAAATSSNQATTPLTSSSTSPGFSTMTTTSSTLSSCSGMSSSSACPSVSSPADAGPQSSLTPAEAIGASIAAFGGLFIILGLTYLSIWWRRKKQERAMLAAHNEKGCSPSSSGQSEFQPDIDLGKRLPSLGLYGGSPLTRPESVHFTQPIDTKESLALPSVEMPQSHEPTRQYQRANHPAALGIGQAAMSSQRPQANMCQFNPLGYNHEGTYTNPQLQTHNRSQESLRRLSQLLPERPVPPMVQPSQRLARAPYQVAPFPPQASKYGYDVHTPATIFEEHKSPTRNETTANVYPTSPMSKSILARNQADVPIWSQKQMQERNKQPNLSLQIPAQSRRPVLPNSTLLGGMPQSHHGELTSRSYRDGSSGRATEDILSYYEGATDHGQIPPNMLSSRQMPQSIPAAITVTRPPRPTKTASSRKGSAGRTSVRNSGGSETSFESADPDEPTPPEHVDKPLSPVEEQHSPISGLRYPKIPRSANQFVPRSPPLRPDSSIAYGTAFPATPQRHNIVDSSLSGSTLAARRQGDSVARDLERMLKPASQKLASPYLSPARFQGSLHASRPVRQESPLQGYGPGGRPRVAKDNATASMQSSGKVPVEQATPYQTRLTMETRRGDDLYFSVSSLPSPR